MTHYPAHSVALTWCVKRVTIVTSLFGGGFVSVKRSNKSCINNVTSNPEVVVWWLFSTVLFSIFVLRTKEKKKNPWFCSSTQSFEVQLHSSPAVVGKNTVKFHDGLMVLELGKNAAVRCRRTLADSTDICSAALRTPVSLLSTVFATRCQDAVVSSSVAVSHEYAERRGCQSCQNSGGTQSVRRSPVTRRRCEVRQRNKHDLFLFCLCFFYTQAGAQLPTNGAIKETPLHSFRLM